MEVFHIMVGIFCKPEYNVFIRGKMLGDTIHLLVFSPVVTDYMLSLSLSLSLSLNTRTITFNIFNLIKSIFHSLITLY